MTTVSLEYLGVHTSGKNVTEAKQEAARMVEHAMKADYTPSVIIGRIYSSLIYNTPSGWMYTTTRNAELTSGINTVHSCATGEDNKLDLIRRVSLHLAECNWSHDQPDTSPLLADYPHEQREFASWCNWQRGYKAARESGMSDSEARNAADNYIWQN